LHPKSIHTAAYDFNALTETHPELAPYVFRNEYDQETIDFSIPAAVLHLNKAILKQDYNLTDWNIPTHYLCPPIPGRAEYIHHIADILSEQAKDKNVRGLDIGMGANCIYPILGAQIYNWKMVGADIDANAFASAEANVKATKGLAAKIEIRKQNNNANLFEDIIQKDEYFDFTICNPPFHASEEEATKGTLRKLRNLRKEDGFQTKDEIVLNFGGQASELWCNGGEALFIKRLIKQSSTFKTQVGFFSTLVSKKENLNKIYKQLDKLKALHKTVVMNHGNKKSRFVYWWFEN